MREAGYRVDRGALPAAGLTLLELVMALALAGLVATAGVLLARPSGAPMAAEGARAFLLGARLEALWTGRAVAVIAAGRPILLARSGDGSDAASACGGRELRRLELARYGPVWLVQPLRAGIVWLPGGGARSCGGGGVISGKLVLADRRRRVSVIVSSLGRVRTEAAP